MSDVQCKLLSIFLYLEKSNVNNSGKCLFKNNFFLQVQYFPRSFSRHVTRYL